MTPPAATALVGRRPPPWRLAGLFLALAALFALPFLLYGEAMEAWLAAGSAAEWLERRRGLAWLAAILLLAADLLLPVPNTMVIAALGALYGPLLGGLLATLGSCLSGLLGYGLCRRFGRPLAVRLAGAAELAEAERLFARSGGLVVALSRWLPVVPEVVACMAGLAAMRLPLFATALVCGAAPVGFLVAFIGWLGADRPILTLALCALLPLPLWLAARRLAPALAGRR